jgi:hypothetical protein
VQRQTTRTNFVPIFEVRQGPREGPRPGRRAFLRRLALLGAAVFGEWRQTLALSGELMTAEATVERYFEALKGKGDWGSLFSESVVFTSYTSPVRRIVGRPAFLEATQRFYTSVVSVEIRAFIAEGDQVCALTHYELRAAAGNTFTSEVAEIFGVANAVIISFDIYFDSAPFPK